MGKKAGRARKCRACAVGAFGDGVLWGHISQVQPGEVEGLATDREEWNKTLPQAAPHPGLVLSHSTLPPRVVPEQTGELARQKEQDSPDQGTAQPPVGLQAPHSGRDSTLGT